MEYQPGQSHSVISATNVIFHLDSKIIHCEKAKRLISSLLDRGSAGSVMASRLSENGKWSVLLIEAGSTDNVLQVKLPAAFPRLFKSEQDWNYWTVPQPGCNDRSIQWPRGKMLGGSSNMNAMIWHRGHRSDFDEMGKVNPGWSYDDCLPHFVKCENNLGKEY